MEIKLKLHEAIEKVLQEQQGHTASTLFLSDEIYNRGLYYKKDGGKAMASQMFLRAKNYPHLFDIIDRNTIKLKTDEQHDIESFSWKIISDIAIKHLDKSTFLHQGTGIPKDIREFFSVKDLNKGEKINVHLHYGGISYPAKIEMSAHDTPRTRLMWKADFSSVLHNRFPEDYKAHLNNTKPPLPHHEMFLKKIDNVSYSLTFITPQSMVVDTELQYRLNIWSQLKIQGGPINVKPAILRDLKIYGGAQGIWVNKERTKDINHTGITVSLLHTGSSYEDDLSSDGVLYHYPDTNRPAGRDQAEIEATKTAGRLGLPVFVITYPSPNSTLRDVHLGWVESWDDGNKVFLITFDEMPTGQLPQKDKDVDNEPFELIEKKNTSKREMVTRNGQQRFKFHVFKRYGSKCTVCGLDIPELLDAAHIRPKSENGSDDPRNGLVLCAIHHRALDAGFYAFEPITLKLRFKETGPEAEILKITHSSINHLDKKPHKEALEWFWRKWTKQNE